MTSRSERFPCSFHLHSRRGDNAGRSPRPHYISVRPAVRDSDLCAVARRSNRQTRRSAAHPFRRPEHGHDAQAAAEARCSSRRRRYRAQRQPWAKWWHPAADTSSCIASSYITNSPNTGIASQGTAATPCSARLVAPHTTDGQTIPKCLERSGKTAVDHPPSFCSRTTTPCTRRCGRSTHSGALSSWWGRSLPPQCLCPC
jgi:hypothetical protein